MFNGGNGGFSLADIAAAVRGSGEDGGFGNNGWWIIIILLAVWGGFGNGGWGNGNNGGSRGSSNGGGENTVTYVPYPMSSMGGWGGNAFAFSDAAMQRGFDNQAVITKLDGLNSGICSLGYDQLAQFNTVNSNILQTANQNTIANMQSFNALSTQLAGCCCDQKAMVADLKYDMATSDCSIKTLINQVAQQLMFGQQTGLRDLMDLINNKFCQLENSQKDALITDLRAQLASCGQNNALQALYNQLVATLHPQAVPAFPAANPNGMGNWSPNVLSNGNGFSSCCCN